MVPVGGSAAADRKFTARRRIISIYNGACSSNNKYKNNLNLRTVWHYTNLFILPTYLVAIIDVRTALVGTRHRRSGPDDVHYRHWRRVTATRSGQVTLPRFT